MGIGFTQVKIKNLTKEQLTISFDRLTRFKFTEDKYLRVFKDIVLSNLIEPKFKRKDLDLMDYNSLKEFAVYIINTSLEDIFGKLENDLVINNKIFNYEKQIFNFSKDTEVLLNNNINYNLALRLISEKSAINLKWLKYLRNHEFNESSNFRFPIKKIVVTEGLTEEILLPVFAKICGLDFDKTGIQIVSAGGKNQVVKAFYKLAEQSKLPIFVLLDNDAKTNYEQIMPKLRDIDKIHLLSGGEIEDILPKDLILRTLNDYFLNLSSIDNSDFEEERMVKNLEEIFKRKGFHEFKKAEFAQLISSHIKSVEDISPEIKLIVSELSAGLLSFNNAF